MSKKCELSTLTKAAMNVASAIGEWLMKFGSTSVLVMLGVAAVAIPKAHAANIITFDNNATACGGATLCSFNGMLGYTGTLPFDYSTLSSWFQIELKQGKPPPAAPLVQLTKSGPLSPSAALGKAFAAGR